MSTRITNATISRFADHPEMTKSNSTVHEEDLHEPDTHNTHSPRSSSPSAEASTPAPPSKTADGKKPCSVCHTPRNVLIRCQTDASKKWNFVCTGPCWQSVSGGFQDGTRDFPNYKYGGMWKNKRAEVPISAKIKGKAKGEKSTDTGFVARPKYVGYRHGTGKKREKSLRVDGAQGADGNDDQIGDSGGEEDDEEEELRRAIEASLADQEDVGKEERKVESEAVTEQDLRYDQASSKLEEKNVAPEEGGMTDDEDWVRV